VIAKPFRLDKLEALLLQVLDHRLADPGHSDRGAGVEKAWAPSISAATAGHGRIYGKKQRQP
jgi:hypothetical protein